MEQNESLTAVLERSTRRAGEADRLAKELEAARAEAAQREAELRRQLNEERDRAREREADLRRKIVELEGAERAAGERVRSCLEEISHLRSALVQARADTDDAVLREERATGEHAALTALTRQQEDEIAVLRGRLYELMASRWRRYGQRLHLCMTMPWEHELAGRNGHA